MQRGVVENLRLAPNAKRRAGEKPVQGSAMGMRGHYGSIGIGGASPRGDGILGFLVKARANNPWDAPQLGEGVLGLCANLPAGNFVVPIRDVV